MKRFLFIVTLIGLSVSQYNRRKVTVKQPKYDMGCNCGLRPSNLVSEKDCQVSAAMEQLDQGEYFVMFSCSYASNYEST